MSPRHDLGPHARHIPNSREALLDLLLKKPENFENDYDNDNDSDDVEDISVHGPRSSPWVWFVARRIERHAIAT
jgi:hypothetical protein